MGKLYLVPTPIGNLEDMSFRAVRVLKEVDLILVEDTRVSGKLLKHFNIEAKMAPHHKFNEHKIVERLAVRMAGGEDIALITDAGTPAISDPGYLLIRTCIEEEIAVESLPGATAIIPALVNSGLPCNTFCFEGFFPQKKNRHKRVGELMDERRTMVFYESPHRLVKTLTLFATYFGEDRRISVARELTKLHEENRRGTIAEVLDYYRERPVKGEIVIVVEGKRS